MKHINTLSVNSSQFSKFISCYLLKGYSIKPEIVLEINCT